MLTQLSIPTSCLTETWFIPATGTKTPEAGLGNSNDPSCWPGPTRNPGSAISPAICPSGYTSACDINPESRKDASETMWACCPSNFVCDGGVYSCIRSLSDSTPRTYFLTTTNDAGGITTTPLVIRAVNAHSVRVAFHSSDIIDESPITTGPSLPTATPPPTASSPLLTSTSSVNSSATNPNGLSAGGLIGIGVASAFGAIFLLSAVFRLVWRRHRDGQQKQQPPTTTISSSQSTKRYTELFSMSRPSELGIPQPVHELDSRAPNNSTFTHGP
ncbi:hypothetical protein GGR58DRAFT_508899 [Xylaria digitata]|nr:hypothetical protein GGR58DRAFT_508899 [Xylaria digitata]